MEKKQGRPQSGQKRSAQAPSDPSLRRPVSRPAAQGSPSPLPDDMVFVPEEKPSRPKAQRQSRPQPKKPSPQAGRQGYAPPSAGRSAPALSPEEELLRRRHRQMQTFRYKKEKKKLVRLFFRRAALCFLFFLVLFGASVGLFFLNLTSASPSHPDSLAFLMSETDGKDEKAKNVDSSRIYFGGAPYLCITDMAELYGFTTTGDRQKLRYITDLAKDENILVTIGTTEAVVNGTAIRLSAPCLRQNGKVYLPLDFFTDYVNGLAVRYSESDAELTVARITIGYNGDTAVYEPISFALKPSRPCQAVSINDIP